MEVDDSHEPHKGNSNWMLKGPKVQTGAGKMQPPWPYGAAPARRIRLYTFRDLFLY
jgi:hypothetical protein